MKVYYIMGKYKDRTPEEIDMGTSKKVLESLLRDYQSAYGPTWSLWIETKEVQP